MSTIKRVSTGIKGLDKQLNGGIPENRNVVVGGGPGTGKTTVALQFIVDGLKKGERCVYFTTEQKKDDLYLAASIFGWDLGYYEKKQQLAINYLDILKEAGNYTKKILLFCDDFKPQRVVFDSVSSLIDALFAAGDKSTTYTMLQIEESMSSTPRSGKTLSRMVLYKFLQTVAMLKATVLITSEIENHESMHLSEKELTYGCDGIILLKLAVVGGGEDRSLQALKMRYTKIDARYVNYDFTDNGIVVKEED